MLKLPIKHFQVTFTDKLPDVIKHNLGYRPDTCRIFLENKNGIEEIDLANQFRMDQYYIKTPGLVIEPGDSLKIIATLQETEMAVRSRQSGKRTAAEAYKKSLLREEDKPAKSKRQLVKKHKSDTLPRECTVQLTSPEEFDLEKALNSLH